MQWFLIRRIVEFILFSPIYAIFRDCHDFAAYIQRVNSLDEINKVGVAVCIIVVASGIMEVIVGIWKWMFPPKQT